MCVCRGSPSPSGPETSLLQLEVPPALGILSSLLRPLFPAGRWEERESVKDPVGDFYEPDPEGA